MTQRTLFWITCIMKYLVSQSSKIKYLKEWLPKMSSWCLWEIYNAKSAWNNGIKKKIDFCRMVIFAKGNKPFFHSGPFSEILTVINLQYTINKIRTRTEPEFGLYWIKVLLTSFTYCDNRCCHSFTSAYLPKKQNVSHHFNDTTAR